MNLEFSDAEREGLRRKLSRLFKADVPETTELRRILALRRRVWEKDNPHEDLDMEGLVELLTGYLKREGGEQVLWPVQAKALQDVYDIGGLFGPIPVGLGKTLISILAPVVLESERPLLVIPAKLRGKTQSEREDYGLHWQPHSGLVVVSYEKLSREYGTEFLENCNPDLLIFDEAHRLRNLQAAVTRRISHWMDQHPETKVVAMSGTITKRSLLDFVHLVRWCLPEALHPLPRYERELGAWAAAVDVIKPHEQRMQGGVGALRLFCNEEEATQGRDGVRSALRRRIQETPGVVASQGMDVDASLNIVLTKIDGYSQRTEELARGLLEQQKPNGDVITERDLAARWRLFRTLTSGFWYKWEPPPPKEWLKRRRTWKWFVNSVLDENIPGLESEGMVARAVATGKLGRGEQEYKNWVIIRDTYTPQVIPVWEDDRMIRAVRDWTHEHQGIIWVSEVALGEKLEAELELPYFHELGLNRHGKPIEDTRPQLEPHCIVASVSSNSEGRNLQAWSDNLILSLPPTGTVCEQILGRTHRPGQEADEVWAEVYFGCRVEWECWLQAMRDAEYASKIEGPKKLTYAAIERTFTPEYGGNALWPVQ